MIKRHYQELFNLHGNAPAAVQWKDRETQYKRFEILSNISDNLKSVIDVGCGLGQYFKYLEANGFKGKYLGYDIVPEFISECNKLFLNNENATASLISDDESYNQEYEFIIASGIFNNKRENNFEFMKTKIKNMIFSAKTGVAFNALSKCVEYEDMDLYYSDPLVIFDYIKNEIGAYPILKHDYILSKNGYPYEYTIYAFKEPNYG